MVSQGKITSFAALLLAGGLALTGCSASPSDAGSESKSTQQEAQTASWKEMTADDFAQRVGDAQLKAGSTHMTMSVSESGVDAAVEADVTMGEKVEDLGMRMVMSIPDAGDIEMLLVDSTMYMNGGELTQNKYMKMTPEMMGGTDVFAEMSQQADPAAQFEAWSDALVDFTASEGEKIDGVETKKYEVVLDTKKMLADQDIPASSLDGLGETVTYEIFIAKDDLPRRISMNLGTGSTVIDFSKWGEKVDIKAPAADQLVDPATLGM